METHRTPVSSKVTLSVSHWQKMSIIWLRVGACV